MYPRVFNSEGRLFQCGYKRVKNKPGLSSLVTADPPGEP